MLKKWFSHKQGNGGTRYRLHTRRTPADAWKETPFFVDAAPHKAHYTYGCKYGLYGAGMGTLIENADQPYRIAACFGGFTKLAEAKQEAEKLLKEA